MNVADQLRRGLKDERKFPETEFHPASVGRITHPVPLGAEWTLDRWPPRSVGTLCSLPRHQCQWNYFSKIDVSKAPGETVETVSDFIFGGSKITADGDCNHEIKRLLLLGRKVMTNLDSIFKSRNITLSTKVHLVKAMVFPVVMYGCELGCEESWAPKNWCFWTVVLEKTLESPLDCKKIQPVHPRGN